MDLNHNKHNGYKYSLHFLMFCLLLFSIYACGGGDKAIVKPNFKIDGQDSKVIGDIKGSPNTEDPSEVIVVSLFEEVTFADATKGADIQTRKWNFGDNHSEIVTESQINHAFENSGFFKVELCVDDKGCVTKYVFVEEEVVTDLQETEPLSPSNLTVSEVDKCQNDFEKPSVRSCPSKITQKTSFDKANVAWPAPIFIDNCGVAKVKSNYESGTSAFTIGTTEVVYTATDKSGNEATCSFLVEVIAEPKSGITEKGGDPCASDNIPPFFSNCPTNIVKKTTESSSVVSWNAPTAEDACGVPTVKVSHENGSLFPIGKTSVEYIATDRSGKTNKCAFTIEVIQEKTAEVVPEKPRPKTASRPSYAGVHSKDIDTNTCSDFSVSSGSVSLKAKENLVLMGGIFYSSGCGRLNVTLQGNGANQKESFELTRGKTQVVFDELQGIELISGMQYTLSYSTDKSENCAEDAPKLLNAKSCGKNASSSDVLDVQYGSDISIFKIKYQN